jgi:predicted CxxxxCH...CXXCH cytochrome family protein
MLDARMGWRARSFVPALLAVVAVGCGGGGKPGASGNAKGQAGQSYSVSVSRPAGGTIRSADGKIACGPQGRGLDACGPATYAWTEAATLTATADAGFVFQNWAGSCQQDGACVLDTTQNGADKWVIAVFATPDQLGHDNWTSPAVHAPRFYAFLAGKPDVPRCTSCHGAGYDGNEAAGGLTPSCNACHARAGWTAWQTNCSFCHGARNATTLAGYDASAHPEYAAPPDDVAGRISGSNGAATGAHAAHINPNAIAPAIRCGECHTVPTTLAHVNGVDDVVFGSIATTGGSAPRWSGSDLSCSATYCHGNFPGGKGSSPTPAWTASGTVTCESCHGNPPPAPHPQVSRCSFCHEGYSDRSASPQTVNLANHVNGVVDARALSCVTCHGTPGRSTDPLLSAAPPRSTGGETSTDRPAVGAHQAHLTAGPFAAALSCSDCHDVPSSFEHADLTDPQLTFSPLASGAASAIGTALTPSYDRATATCSSTYCHGNFRNGNVDAPVWTSTGGGVACGSCHGLPPAGSHLVTKRDCGNCHAGYTASSVNPLAHVNGIPDVSMSCTSCHSGALQAGDANGAPLAAAPSTGAHVAHLQGSAIRGPLACSECHAVPGSLTHSNANGDVQFAFGALASSGNTTATVSGTGLSTSCANYCHGATLDTPAAAQATTWDSTSGTTCTSCHGFPPRTPYHQAVLSATSASACNKCHPATVTAQGAIDVAGGHHVDGKVDVIQLTCTTCHGDSTPGGSAAPPLATSGASDTTSVSVGAHQAHVAPRLASPVACTECHGAAVASYTTGHADGTVQIAFGARAGAATAWDHTSATCASSRCHGGAGALKGGARTTPVWTQVDGTQATCDSCHGNPPADNAHAGVSDCAGCHGDGYSSSTVVAATHVDGAVTFKPGTTCATCHAEHGAMTAATTYHHVMAADASVDAPYPTNNSPLDGPDKSCLMCHVRHGELGAGETLRTSITNPSVAAGDDATLCTSCHVNDQTKSSGQLADGTLKTAGFTDTVGWNAAQNTGHNYTVAGSFPAGAAASGAFAVNCTKCHNSSTTRYQGGGTATFALHDSTDRRLRAPLGRDTVPDDQNEAFCFRCHSNVGDLDASGNPLPGALKPADLKDWYGGHDMPNGSTGVFKQMSGTPPVPTTVTTTLNVKPLAQEPVSGNQPTGPSGENVGKVVTNTLYLTSTTSAGPAGYLLSSGTYTTTTLRQHAMAIASSAASTSVTVNTTTGTTAYDKLAQFLSPPVATAFTWSSGASLGLNLYRSESNTNNNCFFRYAVYKWSQGTATQIVTTANGATEFPTTAASGSQSMSTSAAVTFAANDQVLVEVEVFKNAPTSSGTCNVQWGNQTADGSRLTLPATTTGTFPEFQGTNPTQGGSWTVRSMSPPAATATNDTITGTGTATAYATQLWDRVSFVSPAVNAPVTLPASAWTLNVVAGRGSLSSSTAYLRYRIYQWTGSNLPGLEIVPWTTSSSALQSTAANVAVTTPAGATVALSAGDKVVVEVEVETMNTTAAATANASLSTNGSSVVLPAAVTWTYTTPGVTPTVGHLGSRYSGLHKPNPAEENLQYLAANKHVECSDCHDAHQARRGNQADGGTATAGANGSLTDTNQSWAPNAWKGFYVDITSGTGSGGRAQITANTATTLTFASGTTPGSGSGYRIAMKANGGAVMAASANTLTDTQSAVGGAKAWQTNAFAGWMVNVVLGPGAGESHLIASNTGNQLTIVDTWTTTPATASRYVIGKPPYVMTGATGVNVTAWGASWGAANTVNPAPNSTTPLPEATTEWQVCFKCHSSANANLAGWSPTGVTFTDVAQQFNPNNGSGHPVAAPAAAGAGGSTQVAAGRLVNGWKPGDVMYCSDCHGNNDTSYGASQGPHASAVPFMLRGPNTRWPTQADGTTRFTIGSSKPWTTGQGTKDGLFCLNCHDIGATPHTTSDHNSYSVACTSCHLLLPHGGKLKRLIGTVTPVPWAASTAYPRYAAVSNGASWYYLTTSGGGTSGGTAPTCTSGTCSDGAITWTYGGTTATTPGVPSVYRDTGVPFVLRAYAGGSSDNSTSCGALCTTHHNLAPSAGVNTW